MSLVGGRHFTVDIRPDVTSLRMFKSLSFTPWYALGEFIDNSITSGLINWKELVQTNGRDYELEVRIKFNSQNNSLTISDNAAGITQGILQNRALRTGIPPEDTSIGLSRHGVGLKAAGLWWGNRITIDTFPLEERTGWRAVIDISSSDLTPEVEVQEIEYRGFPGTVVQVEGLGKKVPQTKTVSAIKAYLRSIYRAYLTDPIGGEEFKCSIYYEEDLLSFEAPKLLTAPFWPDKEGPGSGEEAKLWRSEVEIPLKSGLSVSGWYGILETMNRDLSGFFLHYRRKGIAGVAPLATDDSEDLEEAKDAVSRAAYKPRKIFKQRGSYPDQSFIGEFDITGFGKSITTDSPLWSPEEESEFIEEISKHMNAGNFNRMATNFRRNKEGMNRKRKEKEEDRRALALIELGLSDHIDHGIDDNPMKSSIELSGEEISSLTTLAQASGELPMSIRDRSGHVHQFWVSMIEDRSKPFLGVKENVSSKVHQIVINMGHPSLDDLVVDHEVRNAIRRLSLSVGAAEVMLTSWDKYEIRQKMNEILSTLGKVTDNEPS